MTVRQLRQRAIADMLDSASMRGMETLLLSAENASSPEFEFRAMCAAAEQGMREQLRWMIHRFSEGCRFNSDPARYFFYLLKTMGRKHMFTEAKVALEAMTDTPTDEHYGDVIDYVYTYLSDHLLGTTPPNTRGAEDLAVSMYTILATSKYSSVGGFVADYHLLYRFVDAGMARAAMMIFDGIGEPPVRTTAHGGMMVVDNTDGSPEARWHGLVPTRISNVDTLKLLFGHMRFSWRSVYVHKLPVDEGCRHTADCLRWTAENNLPCRWPPRKGSDSSGDSSGAQLRAQLSREHGCFIEGGCMVPGCPTVLPDESRYYCGACHTQVIGALLASVPSLCTDAAAIVGGYLV